MPTRAQLVAAINTFRGRTPTNPIDDDELADFMQGWLDYYDQTGAWNPADVQGLLAQNVALQSSLVTRSLNNAATIYVNPINGDDTRTGENSGNTASGAVKSLARVAQLHSSKTLELDVYIVGGTLDHAVDVTINVPIVKFHIQSALTFKKKTITVGGTYIGDGTFRVLFPGRALYIIVYSGCTINVEAGAGSSGLGDQIWHRASQGAFSIIGSISGQFSEFKSVYVQNLGTINVGNNTYFLVNGSQTTAGFNSPQAISKIANAAPILGANAIAEYGFVGSRVFPRNYTPTSSTDVNVLDQELVSDANFLYRKHGTTIKKVAWSSF